MVDPTTLAQAPIPGFGHDYVGMGSETVNPADGTISFDLPISTPQGRQLSFPFGIRYHSSEPFYLYNNNSSTFRWVTPVSIDTTHQLAFEMNGWAYKLPHYEAQAYVVSSSPDPSGGGPGGGSGGGPYNYCWASGSFNFLGFDGNGSSLNVSNLWADPDNPQPSSVVNCGTPFPSGIGDYGLSAAFGTTGSANQPSLKVTDRSGTVYQFPDGPTISTDPSVVGGGITPWGALAQTITDRNGNQIKLSGDSVILGGNTMAAGSYIDTVGRPVVKWSGFGNTGGGDQLTIAGLASNVVVHWTTTTVTFPTGFQFLGGTTCSETANSLTIPVVSEIDLPGQPSGAYSFTYGGKWGQLIKITFPEGGYVRYVWGTNSGSTYTSQTWNDGRTGGSCTAIVDTPAITDRYVSYDGSTEALHQTFQYSTAWNSYPQYPGYSVWGTKTTTMTAYDLVTGSNSTTTYTYANLNSTDVPVEQQIAYVQAGQTLKTINETWFDRFTKVGSQTILSNGQGSTTLNCPSQSDQILATYQYNFQATGPTPAIPACAMEGKAFTAGLNTSAIGPLLEQTATSYHSFPNANILDFPDNITVSDGSGIPVRKTQYGYDGSAVLSPVAPTQTGHVAPPGNRGNVTSVSRWLNTNNSLLTTTYTYYDNGQLQSVTDPCGNTTCSDMSASSSHKTTYVYTDSPAGGDSAGNSNSYLTQITRPNTGVAHTESYQYDYALGKITQSSDENTANVTHYRYNTPPSGCSQETDGLNRLSEVDYPDSGKTTYCYNDAAPSPSVTTSRLLNASGTLEVSTSTMDGLGHTVQTQLVSNPSPEGPVFTDTTYDGLGHVHTVSNPHLSSSSPSDGTTTYAYDALGRKTLQCQQDNGNGSGPCVAGNSYLQWTYSGNTVDSYDETRRHWQRTSDALGRLTKVLEPDGSTTIGNAPTLETDYQYDALNDLTRVDQWGGPKGSVGDRVRTFLYDSLSRLTRACNPESIADGWACSTSGPWSAGYSYDANGNVITKTDARNITTTYYYDGLNRMTSEQATGINYGFLYDVAANGAIPQTNLIGRLSYFSNLTNADTVYSYDQMGRVIGSAFFTPSSPDNTSIKMTATYDLAGNIHTLLYPDGRLITQNWDGGNHLTGVDYTSFNGASIGYTYMGTIGQFSPGYWPNGSPKAIFYGNGVADGQGLNNRLQSLGNGPVRLQGVGPGTYSENVSLASKVICYGPAVTAAQTASLPCPSFNSANNGNIFEIIDPLNGANSQTFSYDNLNRLKTFAINGAATQSYNLDSWGNLSFNTAFAVGVNNRFNTEYGYDAAGNVTAVPNPTNPAGTLAITYDAEGKLTSANSGAAVYTYNADGSRVRKDFGGAWTEYVYFGGEPIAEKSSDGTWSDYIYGNGQKMARADNYDINIHLSGTNCSNCGANPNMFAGVTSLAAANGHVIQRGDVLTWRQYQKNSALGGLEIYLSHPNGTGLDISTSVDTEGQVINADTTKGTWHVRTVDLTAYAGDTIQLIDPFDSMNAPPGEWDIYYGDIVLTSTNGSFIPIYSRSMMTLSLATAPGVSNFTAVTEKVLDSNPLTTTTYYHHDQIGSTQLSTSGTGWPTASDTYYPFGAEPPSSGGGDNHYKFTGKERDAESGNDYFGARYYSSSMGRFMSPDWSAQAEPVPFATMDNPQTLNLYSYMRNNPLSGVDSDGHSPDWYQRLRNWWLGYGNLTDAQLTARTEDQRQWLLKNNTDPKNADAIQHASTGDVINTYGCLHDAGCTQQAIDLGRVTLSAAGAPMLGANGTQTTSKTLWGDGKEHIDVENPNPGQRPGQIHYQDGTGKYIYDVATGEFRGLSSTASKQLLSKPGVQEAISKGLRYLGVAP